MAIFVQSHADGMVDASVAMMMVVLLVVLLVVVVVVVVGRVPIPGRGSQVDGVLGRRRVRIDIDGKEDCVKLGRLAEEQLGIDGEATHCCGGCLYCNVVVDASCVVVVLLFCY